MKAKSVAASLRNLPDTWLALIGQLLLPGGINAGLDLTSDPAATIALQAQSLTPPPNTRPPKIHTATVYLVLLLGHGVSSADPPV